MESNENYDTSSIYDGLSSIYDEESSPSNDTLPDSETDGEDIPVNNDESLYTPSDETSSSISSSYDDFISDSALYSDTVSTVESSCESSSITDSYAEYLHSISENTAYTMYFVFAFLLLFIVAIFARFLNNLIM